MKIILLILTLLSTAIGFSQKNTDKDKALIKEVIVKSFDEIWSNMDSKLIEKFYTKDFILLENGEIWNNDSIVSNFEKARLQEKTLPKRINKIDFVEVKIANGMAWVAYHNQGTWSLENKFLGKANWLESAVLIYKDKSWKIQMLHSTIVKNE